MKATEILMSEHRVIEQLLVCLERIAEIARDERRLLEPQAAAALEVIGTFADRCHHGKEEEVLFARLERHGLPRSIGPLGVMLNEHELGRRCVARMRAELEAKRPATFASAALEYVTLLREHIAKEDGVLFPMADSMLGADEQAEALAEFARRESVDLGAGTHERMLGIVERLTGELGVEKSVASAATHGGGCCHGTCHS